MIFIWAFIGIIVGLLLGLTGAGGAIVAVPLFVYLADTSIRDATSLALIAVMAGSILNWFVQFKNTNFGLAVLLFAFSTVGSLLFKPIKDLSPDWVITLFFITVTLISLFLIWRKSNVKKPKISQGNFNTRNFFLKSIAGGIGLGGLVTMTGLGGGVVLVPLLKNVYSLSLSKAAATSLFTIFLSSIFSFWVQRSFVSDLLQPSLAMALVGGSVISSLITRQLINQVKSDLLNFVRKILLTSVILLSVISLLFKI